MTEKIAKTDIVYFFYFQGGVNVGSLPDGLNLRSEIRLDVSNVLARNESEGPLYLREHFRGCMSDTRINNILLPVFSPKQLVNNTAMNIFKKMVIITSRLYFLTQ